MSLGLGALGLLNWLWSLTGNSWPKLPGWAYGLLFFLCLAGLLAGLFLLIHYNDRRRLLGGLVTAAFAVVLILISEGPLGVPILTLGIPGVLSLYFDVFSGVIQAFVFSLLTMIYISGNCPPPEQPEDPDAPVLPDGKK